MKSTDKRVLTFINYTLHDPNFWLSYYVSHHFNANKNNGIIGSLEFVDFAYPYSSKVN